MKLNVDDGRRGRGFEKLIGLSFDGYAAASLARFDFMPTPTKVIGSRNGRLVLVQCGKPSFDIYGYTIANATFIGAELKSSGRKTSLPIVNPKNHGGGLQLHQISALASVAQSGGIARIVWENGGDIGILTNDDIILAADVYMHAMATENSGRKPKSGTKSIEWEKFTPVIYESFGGVIAPEWLRYDLVK